MATHGPDCDSIHYKEPGGIDIGILKQSEHPGVGRFGAIVVVVGVGRRQRDRAVEKAGSFDPEKVMAALESGISFDGPGGTVTTQENHHLTKNVYIGETLPDGQFKVVDSFDNVVGEPFLKGTFK